MGFIRRQQIRIAIRLLAWQYHRSNMGLPPYKELESQAGQLVKDAHRIARERGKNVMSIIKEMVADVMKR
jgi:hypothetical protein